MDFLQDRACGAPGGPRDGAPGCSGGKRPLQWCAGCREHPRAEAAAASLSELLVLVIRDEDQVDKPPVFRRS